MSRVAIACSTVVIVVGCAKHDQAAKDSATASAMTAPPPAPAPAAAPAATLGDFAGTWDVSSTPESGKDTTPTKYVLTATADTTGWSITFPSGLKVPLHVAMTGDSVTEHTGTFASQRRKGMKVMTEGSLKLQNGKLTGSTTAHYMMSGADSVLHLRTEGTKKP